MQLSIHPARDAKLVFNYEGYICSFLRIRADVIFFTRVVLHLIGATKHVDRQLDILWFCIIFNLFTFFLCAYAWAMKESYCGLKMAFAINKIVVWIFLLIIVTPNLQLSATTVKGNTPEIFMRAIIILQFDINPVIIMSNVLPVS